MTDEQLQQISEKIDWQFIDECVKLSKLSVVDSHCICSLNDKPCPVHYTTFLFKCLNTVCPPTLSANGVYVTSFLGFDNDIDLCLIEQDISKGSWPISCTFTKLPRPNTNASQQ